MASAFWGGVADNLAGQINQRVTRKEEQKDWEWKAKKAAELEEQIAKTRVASTKVFEQNGQHMMQSYNAVGEPVGNPVPAPPGRVEEYKQGIEERAVTIGAKQSQIDADKTRMARDQAETAQIPAAAAREQRRVDLEASRVNLQREGLELERADKIHGKAERDERTALLREQARAAKFTNDEWEAMTPEQRAAIGKPGGRPGRGYDPMDKTGDWKNVNATITEIAGENEDLAEQLRDEVRELEKMGRTAEQIHSMIVGTKRTPGTGDPNRQRLLDFRSRPD
jgi:hypothetical protein